MENLKIGVFRQKIGSNKGFTLIELMIVFALSGIIAAVAISMNIFSNKVVNKGEKKYNVQSEVNLASELITKYVRHATGVELLDAAGVVPVVVTTDDVYILVADSADGKTMIVRDKTGDKNLIGLDLLDVEFIADTKGRYLIFKVSGYTGAEHFNIESKIVPQNMVLRKKIVVNNAGLNPAVKLKILYEPVTISPLVALEITGSLSGTLGPSASVSGNLSATGGYGSYLFTVSPTSRLPYGTSITNSGTFTGTPQEAGVFTTTINAEDSSMPPNIGNSVQVIQITDPSFDPATDPVVENIKIIFDGSVLKPSYIFNDPDEDATDASEYSWYRSSEENGSGMQLVGNTVNYTPVEADAGQYLFLKVVPVDSLTNRGSPTYAGLPYHIQPLENKAPYATRVDIITQGGKKVGNIVTGDYQYNDDDVPKDLEGISIFKWYRGIQGSANDLIEGENSISYTLKEADIGFYIFFEVTPIALSGNKQSDTKLSSSVGPIQENNNGNH